MMNPVRHIRRFAAVLAGFGAALLMLTAAPAAFAMEVPPRGSSTVGSPLPQTSTTVTRTVVVGGMPGWQITLIALGAALLAATAAVLADRARAARRPAVPLAA